MRPGNRETIPTVSEAVREAAAICDPDGAETAAAWPATNPGQADGGDHVLREGTRLVFEGQPPQPRAEWLGGRGVEVRARIFRSGTPAGPS